MEISTKVQKLLEAEGIGTDPESILAAGLEGLTAVSGIGDKTANELLDMAKAAVAVPVPPEEPRPPDPEPPAEPAEAEEPEQGFDPIAADVTFHFELKLVGRSTAVVDHVSMLEGNVRPISLEILKQTVESYPAGTFQARYRGISEAGDTGWSDWTVMPPPSGEW